MNTTSLSLLERLRQPAAKEAWERFVHLYTPLLYYWARRLGLQPQDEADLVQEVFTVLVQKLPEFAYDRDKSFRGWLRTLTLNTWRNSRRRLRLPAADLSPDDLKNLAGPDGAEVFEETEYRQHLTARALQLIQREFQAGTWKAFWECTVAGRAAADVAAELHSTPAAVYVAKSRVLARLREEFGALLD
jgi:RNA polymerase sigma-70 factor (ECF subfamily)